MEALQQYTVCYSDSSSPPPLPHFREEADGTHGLFSTLVNGEARHVLSMLPTGLARVIVTSPPYWSLRDYGIEGQIGLEQDPEAYVRALVRVFAEARRVLRDDGSLWLNIGDSYTSGGRTWRAPDRKNPVRAMGVRPPTPEGLKPKELVGIPWRLAFALQEDGWYLRSDVIWRKPNVQPESVKDRPTRSHEYLFLLTKSERYYYDNAAVREVNGRNLRSVWDINTRAFHGAHFATFPPRLVEQCILLSSRPREVVLDPFLGSGTVAETAIRLGRTFFGIELNPEYIALARRRILDTAELSRRIEEVDQATVQADSRRHGD